MPAPEILIFIDLDGTLLDHDNYGCDAAIPLMGALEAGGIPVIPATSKTRAEMLAWRENVDNRHPLIVENGAAVLIPEGYFSELPDQLVSEDGYQVMTFVAPRAHWQELLAEAAPRFPGCWRTFEELGEEGIASLTGLDPRDAALASRREYGEPLAWQGSEESLSRFRGWMHGNGANVLLGGRFVHVSGDSDKGRALLWLAELYRRQPGAGTIATVALGDSDNDIAMLQAAELGVVVRSPAHPPPMPPSSVNGGDKAELLVTTNTAPAGWVEGVLAALSEIRPGLAALLKQQVRLQDNTHE